MKLSRDEFEKLALEQLDAVDRVARALARSSAAADDLVQETYLRAFRAADTFDLRAFGMRPWLFRILHNLHTARGQRERKQPLATDPEHLQRLEAPQTTGSAGTIENNDSALARAVHDLPPDLALTITLWAVDDLSYKEIAEVMEVPIGTVMSRLYRARQRLLRRLPHLAPAESEATE